METLNVRNVKFSHGRSGKSRAESVRRSRAEACEERREEAAQVVLIARRSRVCCLYSCFSSDADGAAESAARTASCDSRTGSSCVCPRSARNLFARISARTCSMLSCSSRVSRTGFGMRGASSFAMRSACAANCASNSPMRRCIWSNTHAGPVGNTHTRTDHRRGEGGDK